MNQTSEITFKSEIDVEFIDKMGGDYMVVAAAKVSTNGPAAKEYANADQKANYGLINYLMAHRHGTPFEHSGMILFVHAPIFVWREWHRHRIGFSYNEESARYKPLDPIFYLPPRGRPMMKVEDWKAGRPKFFTCDSDDTYNGLCTNLKDVYQQSYLRYQQNLALGIDPGLARDCLPVGIYSGCWVTCNPRSMMAFLSLRTFNLSAKYISYPLFEINEAANKCEAIFAEHWPLTYEAFVANGRVGP